MLNAKEARKLSQAEDVTKEANQKLNNILDTIEATCQLNKRRSDASKIYSITIDHLYESDAVDKIVILKLKELGYAVFSLDSHVEYDYLSNKYRKKLEQRTKISW